ncbi:hypothetical protein ACIPY5_19680 [Microbacterium sp. NPDC089698]|uniref:hypothetical protein n=1 Tax=Microbacterium sp. NPDC089698 TaxID=3364200 RepID=UPI0038298056
MTDDASRPVARGSEGLGVRRSSGWSVPIIAATVAAPAQMASEATVTSADLVTSAKARLIFPGALQNIRGSRETAPGHRGTIQRPSETRYVYQPGSTITTIASFTNGSPLTVPLHLLLFRLHWGKTATGEFQAVSSPGRSVIEQFRDEHTDFNHHDMVQVAVTGPDLHPGQSISVSYDYRFDAMGDAIPTGPWTSMLFSGNNLTSITVSTSAQAVRETYTVQPMSVSR